MERTFVLIDVPAFEGDSQEAPRAVQSPCLDLALRMACESLCIDRVVAVSAPALDAAAPVASTSTPSLPAGVLSFVSKQPDSLGRVLEAAKYYDARSVILVDGGQWLLDAVFVDRLLVAANEISQCEMIGFIAADGSDLSELDAVFPVWCRTSALERAEREAFRWLDRRSPGHYLQSHPQRYRAGRLALSERDQLAARRCITELLNDPWESLDQACQSLSAEDWDCRRVAERLQARADIVGATVATSDRR
jgi:spore coat polysaccharide biosynthesis protein SpsF (cytidylyltransferase family)